MNDDLEKDIPGTGYLSRTCWLEQKAFLRLPTHLFLKVYGMPVNFDSWSQHLIEVDHPMPVGFLSALRHFLSTNLIRWMEVLSSESQFRCQCCGSHLKKQFSDQPPLRSVEFGTRVSYA